MNPLTLILLVCLAANPAAAPTPPGEGWTKCVYTVYADKFEGRETASGKVFRHAGRTVASRGGKFGDRITLTYFGTKRWHTSSVTLNDRGKLPLHRADRRQYDVSKQVAKDLGLYRADSKDRRVGYWKLEEKR